MNSQMRTVTRAVLSFVIAAATLVVLGQYSFDGGLTQAQLGGGSSQNAVLVDPQLVTTFNSLSPVQRNRS